jgi:hypothetical protein
VQKLSVLPTRLNETIEQARPTRFVARAGNGVVYCRGGSMPSKPPATTANLMQRIKATFDPNHVLPELSL